MRRARFVYELFVPKPSEQRSWRGMEIASFGVGSALSMSWLQSIAGAWAWIAAGLLASGAYFAATGTRRLGWRVTFGSLTIGLQLGFGYFCIAFATVLGWSLSIWAWALGIVLLAVPALGWVRPERFPHFSLTPGMGFLVTSMLLGWLREDGRVRCDDYQRVASDERLEIVVASSARLRTCHAGDVAEVGRYPRGIWESPDGRELVFTTHRGIRTGESAELDGSICSAPVDGSRPPSCIGSGKAQVVAESEQNDRLLIPAWGRFEDGSKGTVYAVSRRPPLRLLASRGLDAQTGELFHDERANLIGLFTDEGEVMIPVNATTLEPGEPIAAPVIPGEMHYDPERREGLICFAAGPLRPLEGASYASVAFRSEPLSLRPLAPSSRYPSTWLALVWGCDWDAQRERAYVAVANMGLLWTIDYRSGDVIERNWIGFGERAVEIDPLRQRLYTANFLKGVVTERELDGLRELRSWFVGRFVRRLALSRDGGSLWAVSSAGVVRVKL